MSAILYICIESIEVLVIALLITQDQNVQFYFINSLITYAEFMLLCICIENYKYSGDGCVNLKR